MYCDNMHGSHDCFGCFGMTKAKHCVLNRRYTSEEYTKLVRTIIADMQARGEWGEFFPIRISAFGYNESDAQGWFPLTKEEALARGYAWSDYTHIVPPQGAHVIPATSLPEDISQVTDDILQYIILSEKNQKPYRIIPQELAFYRKRGLPIPRLHPHERLRELYKLHNPRVVYQRQCHLCHEAIHTTYPPHSAAAIYCDACFLKEIG